MEDIELKRKAVSQYQLKQYHKKMLSYIDTHCTPVETTATIELLQYVSAGSSFTYSESNAYVYSGGNTILRTYGTHAIFKVADIDLYIDYVVSGTTYTYNTQYTSATIPDDAKKMFEISNYAVVKMLLGTEGEVWKVGKYSVFLDSSGLPMKYVFTTIDSTSTFLARTTDKSYIYAYTLNDGVYTFSESAASGTDAYSSFDAYFGEGGSVTQVEETSATPTINLSSYANETYINCTTALTSLAIVNANLAYEVTIHFSVDSSVSGALPITISGSTPYILGDTEDFEAEPDGIYEISIKNGVLVLGTINAAETSGSITINS